MDRRDVEQRRFGHVKLEEYLVVKQLRDTLQLYSLHVLEFFMGLFEICILYTTAKTIFVHNILTKYHFKRFDLKASLYLYCNLTLAGDDPLTQG